VTVLLTATPPAHAQDTPWAERITGYLPARDGTELKYSVLLPEGDGPFPVVVNYSGYDPGSIGGSAYQTGNTTMSPEIDRELISEGYAVMGVNMAGTGCSDGTFDLFAERWSTDGYDAVEWAAEQPWSDGQIGMANWSYAGLSQVLTAIDNPPHLKAIAPGMAVTDPWRDVGYPGGVTNWLFPYSWGIFIQSRWAAAYESAQTEGDAKCIANVDAHNAGFEDVNPYAQLRDVPYITPESKYKGRAWKRADDIKAAVLSMVSWQDEATGPRAGYYQNRLNPRKSYLVGANGPHDSYASNRWRRLLVDFFDRYLKGEDNGFDKKPHVRLWMDSSAPGMQPGDNGDLSQLKPGEVITRRSLPVKVKPHRLWLRSKERLTDAKPQGKAKPDSYAYPDRGPAVNAYLGSDDRQWTEEPASEAGTVAFTTAPLKKALTFYGPASLDLWVSATAPDADIQATITEVRPDGQEVYVQRGWLRLSERVQLKSEATQLLPFQKHIESAVQPLTSSKPIRARLEVNQFAHSFRPGSSIRVLLDTPSTTGGWDFESPEDPATIKVYHDAKHPSRLVMGLLKKGGVETPLPACGTLLMQPCRESTFAVPVGKGSNGQRSRR